MASKKEKRLGYIDLSSKELKGTCIFEIDGITMNDSKAQCKLSINKAYELYPKEKFKIYEVVLREIE